MLHRSFNFRDHFIIMTALRVQFVRSASAPVCRAARAEIRPLYQRHRTRKSPEI
jgi:hypothetical protein